MRYTISEMASLLGVTTHTLRYYEKMGLIHPEVNEDTGYRYYTVTDTRRFNLCRELRAAELSLEECRELIGAPTVEQSDAMFNHQIAQLRRRQVLDELAIRFLEHKREQYRMHLILVHDALNLRNLRLRSHHFRSGGHDVAYSLVKEFCLPFLHGASDITIGNKSDNVVVFIQ